MTFGPTFGDELKAAGLVGLPFGWSSDGSISGRANLTPQQNATLDAVIAAHNSLLQRKNIVPWGVFIRRWTEAEYLALMRARASAITAGSITLIKQFDTAAGDGQVDLNIPEAQAFKAAMVSAGLLTQQRADVIFG